MAVIYSILCFFRCPRCSSSCSCVLTYFECVRSVMHKHLEKMGDVTFDKIFNQKLENILIQGYTAEHASPNEKTVFQWCTTLISLYVTTGFNQTDQKVTSFSKNFAKASVMKNLYPSSSFTKSTK
ncbi:uncharacterized protein LOC143244504 isoform X3 [Tachypleus tridentatus]|uniref:uncharacterized protein LOC143244504 isoform X3 n=1 Tax=Tachypleus tridentatus TaxID=6853 RepID=UPI003FCF4F86